MSKRIALIGSRASIHIVRWANALSEKGYNITVFSMHRNGEKFAEGVESIQLPFKNPYGYILNIPFLKLCLYRLKPHIIHSFYAFGHSFLGRICSGNIPHVVSVMGSDIYDDIKGNKIYRSIIIKNILQADAVCSTSIIMAEQIKKVCKAPKDIVITPFGVDTDKFNPEKFSKKKTNEFIVGTVKWLEDKYGIDVLIRAFELFSSRYSKNNFKLVIVGDGSKREDLEKLAIKLRIKNKCIFIGKVAHKKIPDWLAKFDVYAALSRLDSESFGVAILEASSMKLPVLVSDVGGLTEVVEDFGTGIIVQKENISEAADRLENLYLDIKLREKLGKNGRTQVLQKYDWRESIHKMCKVYEDVLGEH